MARIRTIKPEFWTSEQVVSCSMGARLLFIGMWNFCDDGGVHPKSFKRLKMEIFPGDDYSEEIIQGWIAELIQTVLIEEYMVKNESYWSVTGWKHQKIEKPNIRHPKKPGGTSSQSIEENPEIQRPIDDDSTTTQQPIDDDSTTTRRQVDDQSPTIHPRKGMEGNGKEKEEEKKEIEKEKEIRQVSGETFLRLVFFDKNSLANTHEPGVGPEPEPPIGVSQEPEKNNVVMEIFEHWKTKLDHPHAQLDDKRKKKIKAALKQGFSVEQLKLAIEGCANTPFNMGKNEGQQKYDSIGLIFRDTEKIERFIENASTGGRSQNFVYEKNPVLEGVI